MFYIQEFVQTKTGFGPLRVHWTFWSIILSLNFHEENVEWYQNFLCPTNYHIIYFFRICTFNQLFNKICKLWCIVKNTKKQNKKKQTKTMDRPKDEKKNE